MMDYEMMIKKMDLEFIFIYYKDYHMKDNEKTIKKMEKECIKILMEMYMMVNGKIICAVAPAPYGASHGTTPDSLFRTPTSFYEFDYTVNTFTRLHAPTLLTGDTMSGANEP